MRDRILSPTRRVADTTIRFWCRRAVRRDLVARVEGAERLPASGPALIVCRHYHHLYDGCMLVAAAPRSLRILVALDWVDGRPLRALMEGACALVRWPVVLRAEREAADTAGASSLADQSGGPAVHEHRPPALARAEARRYLLRAARLSVSLLRAGEILVIFPEGYPTIDPVYTPKRDDDAYLPFLPGFLRFTELAQRAGSAPIPIVPAGLQYARGERWRVTLRFGEPLYLDAGVDRAALLAHVEAQVRALSDGG